MMVESVARRGVLETTRELDVPGDLGILRDWSHNAIELTEGLDIKRDLSIPQKLEIAAQTIPEAPPSSPVHLAAMRIRLSHPRARGRFRGAARITGDD